MKYVIKLECCEATKTFIADSFRVYNDGDLTLEIRLKNKRFCYEISALDNIEIKICSAGMECSSSEWIYK